MKRPDFDPLLNDLLADSHYDSFRAQLKQRALEEFRGHRRARRIRGAAFGLASIALVAILIASWKTPPDSKTLAGLTPDPSASVGAQDVSPETTVRVENISDEELLASFPPGSCFLAELDGEMVLVFHDPVLRDQVMR